MESHENHMQEAMEVANDDKTSLWPEKAILAETALASGLFGQLPRTLQSSGCLLSSERENLICVTLLLGGG